jgi:hypothetical protein
MNTGLGLNGRPGRPGRLATSTDESPPRLQRLTYTIDEVAALFGIGRNQAYEGAGTAFPIIRVGRRILVPKAAIDRMLGIANGTPECDDELFARFTQSGGR